MHFKVVFFIPVLVSGQIASAGVDSCTGKFINSHSEFANDSRRVRWPSVGDIVSPSTGPKLGPERTEGD